MNNSQNGTTVNLLVDHLFRHKAGQIIAVLTRIFGMENLALAEDVVQETFIKALQQWPHSGVPSNPGGWILQVARNQALDVLRRDSTFRDKQQQVAAALEEQMGRAAQSEADPLTQEFEDDQLVLMLTCCHPSFTREAQTALILKTLCAFSTAEIARAYLTQESTIAQRLVRAKRRIGEQNIRFELPDGVALAERIQTLLEVLYLMFNEGYGATEGDLLIRRDLCEEAIRLTTLLARSRPGNLPEAHALLSLMFLQASRFAARLDTEGDLVPLAEQDRSLWDRGNIRLGLQHLELSAGGNRLTEYHLQAAIAAHHATAPSHAETNCKAILEDYNELLELNPSPLWKLNRAVAVAEVDGADAALAELDRLAGFTALQSYYLYHATRGEMYSRLNRRSEAAACYRKALTLVGTAPERRFLERKLQPSYGRV